MPQSIPAHEPPPGAPLTEGEVKALTGGRALRSAFQPAVEFACEFVGAVPIEALDEVADAQSPRQ